MKYLCGLKVRCYTDSMIDPNDYLYVFPWSKASDKTCETEWNKSLLNIMPNIWNRQAYMQRFDCETITKKSINMFERMLIAEYIYEVVIETSKIY